MSQTSKKQDYPSDSDLSLQLSDASSLSSDSDLSESIPNKNKKKQLKKPKKKAKSTKKKSFIDNSQYCTCRKGYDGKEFMIECDDCQEWFHGACVGLKPNSVTDHYFCKSCTNKRKQRLSTTTAGKTLIPPPKSMIVLPPISKSTNDHVKKAPPPPKPAAPPAPIVPVIASIDEDDEDDEDLDDICVLCDGDCTCGAVEDSIPVVVTPAPLPAPPPPPIQKIQTKIIIPVPKKPVVKKPVSKKPVPKKPVTKKPVTKKLVPKKTGKAIPSSKKSKMAEVIQNHSSSSSNSSSSSSSNSSSSSSDSNDDSSDEEEVVDRVGIDIKPKKSIVRRGKSTTLLANMKSQPPQPTPRKGKGKKMNAVKFISSEEEDSDEELIVDDLDDLLETMSPLSEHSSNESVLQSEEEFFTDDDETMSPTSYGSSIHIDSGDDEDIENTETQKIINELTLDSDEEESDMDQVVFAQDDEGGVFVEDDDEEDDIEEDDDDDEEHIPNFYYNRHQSHWSSSSEDEEEDEEFDYTTIPEEEEEEEEDSNALLPLLDSEGNLYDSIAAAFMQAFSMNADTTTTTTAQHSGTNTPAAVTLGEDYQLSPFELANALTALSAAEHVFMRRPSLPSSAVSAAQRMRGSQDLSTSDLRAIVSDDLTLSLEPIQESTEEQSSPTTNDNQLFSNDIKLQEQILDILKNSQKEDQKEDSIQDEQQQEEEKVLQPIITNNSTRQILPKPSGSGDSYFPNMLSQTALEQHIQDVLTQSIESSHQSQKRKSTMNETIEKKKLRRSSNIQPMPSSFSTPASPAAIVDEEEEEEEEAVSMDDLVDTSQLYTRSLSRSPSPDISEDDNPYSRDLSRWQRIPIGAFRLMRSKNKLWLER